MNPPRTSIQPDTVIGERYHLVRPIVDDALAEVWAAWDARLDRDVALHILSAAARHDRAAQAHLRRAARGRVLGPAVGQSDSPRILDGGDDPTHGPFVVTELTPTLAATRPLTPLGSLIATPQQLRETPSVGRAPNPLAATDEAPSVGRAPNPLASLDDTPRVAAADPRLAAPSSRPPRIVGRARVAPARRPQGGGVGLFALAAVAIGALVAVVFLTRACAPPAQVAPPAAAPTTAAAPARPLSGARGDAPAIDPTAPPTLAAPAAARTVQATLQPTLKPAAEPAAQPATKPTVEPVAAEPVTKPTAEPVAAEPATKPTATPVAAEPAARPTPQPTAQAAVQRSGQATQPPPPKPTPQAASAAQPAVAGSAVETIRQHYASIDSRRYAEGYALMDAHLRSLNSPADYASWFANKVSIKPLSIDLVSQNGDRAIVRSVVRTTDRTNGQDVTTDVAEQFVLHNEEGTWRIAQVSRL